MDTSKERAAFEAKFGRIVNAPMKLRFEGWMARAEQSTETPPTEIAEKIRARIYLLWQNTRNLRLADDGPVEKETGESK